MILIITTENRETSTEKVIDWLVSQGVNYFRLNCEEFYTTNKFVIDVKSKNSIKFVKNEIDLSEIRVIWFRRSFDRNFVNRFFSKKNDTAITYRIKSHLLREIKASFESFISIFNDNLWVDHPSHVVVNKIRILNKAASVGLQIPSTFITNNFESLKMEKEELITKCVTDGDIFNIGKKLYAHYTASFNLKAFDSDGSVFLPTLFQKQIKKKFEIRSFILNKLIYSMAIFSQRDATTEIDYRHYNNDRPNRCVPFKLPLSIEDKLLELMKLANLHSGSCDLIKTMTNEYVFLEINPIGQFGIVSTMCNYKLEKRIAEYLIQRDENENKKI